MTKDNATDFLPIEKHLRRKKVIEIVPIDSNITFVGEGGERNLIAILLKRVAGSTNPRIDIAIENSKLLITAAAASKILFANIFDVNSNEDVLYYIVAVCNHVNFDIAQTTVTSTGIVPELIRTYFKVE